MNLRLFPMTTLQGEHRIMLNSSIVLYSPEMYMKRGADNTVIAYPINKTGVDFLQKVRRLEERLVSEIYRTRTLPCAISGDVRDYVSALRSCTDGKRLRVGTREGVAIPCHGTLVLETNRVRCDAEHRFWVDMTCTSTSPIETIAQAECGFDACDACTQIA